MNAEPLSWQPGGMNADRTVFSQIMALLPPKLFHRCVDRYQGEHKVKSFSCWDQFLTLAFAQLTYRQSLREGKKERVPRRKGFLERVKKCVLRSAEWG